MTTKGTFRIRHVKHEYLVEELRNGSWMIIESLPSMHLAGEAYEQYSQDGHTVHWL